MTKRLFTLILTIFLHGSSYGLYQISNNSYLLIFAKMFAAGNKVCATIYRPVWIEQFGLSNYKSIFFALVQIMSSYGQIIGFNLGSFLFQENWKLALLSILIIMYIIGIYLYNTNLFINTYNMIKVMYFPVLLITLYELREHIKISNMSGIIP